MRPTLERIALHAIRSGKMLVAGDRVAAAVSGGADSIALLKVLAALRGELGITLLVIHFDHMLRGAESDLDAQFVKDLARAEGFQCMVGREDVAAAAAEQRRNIEDTARRLRYAFFRRIVLEGHANHIAVAHTADDQAETVLARLMRGTGPAGLAAIHPRSGPVVRPLLATRRADLRRYLEKIGQAWREDATNRDLNRQRARIRARLLPAIEADFSPQIVQHLAQLAHLVHEEQVFWTELVENRLGVLARNERKGRMSIGIDDLLSPLGLPRTASRGGEDDGASKQGDYSRDIGRSHFGSLRPLTERLIRRLYESVRGDRCDLTADHVEKVVRLATESSSGRQVDLPGGIVVERVFENLVFGRTPGRKCSKKTNETKGQASSYQYVVSVSDFGTKSISVPELGSRFRLKVIDWPSLERDTNQEGNVFDADLLCGPLIFRNWQPGDAYRPAGHRRIRKLKEMFRLMRVPNTERALWPVLECGGNVIWARGMPAAGDFCPKPDTRVGILVEEENQDLDAPVVLLHREYMGPVAASNRS